MSLKFKNSQKLHISSTPHILKWFLTLGFISCGILFSIISDCSVLIKGCSIIAGLITGLLVLDGWKDVVIDNDIGKAILTKTSCVDRLFCRVLPSNTEIFPIADIIQVTARKNKGVSLQLRDGSCVPIYNPRYRISFKDLNEIRTAVSTFLHLERIETWTRKVEWEFATQFVQLMISQDEELDEQLQSMETEKLAQIGCRNAIKVIATGDRRSDN